ncbi:MAG: hypothetical protein ACYS8W_18190 [Planctomycetota bacterium]|jgi:hypothetical protein
MFGKSSLFIALLSGAIAFSGCTSTSSKDKAMARFAEIRSTVSVDEVDSVVVNGRMGNGRVRADEDPQLVHRFVEALLNAELAPPYETGEAALLTSTRDAEITFVFHDQTRIILEYYHGFGMTISGADQRTVRPKTGTFYAPQWRVFLTSLELERLTAELPSG